MISNTFQHIDTDTLLQNANHPSTFFQLLPEVHFKQVGARYTGRQRSHLSIFQHSNGKWVLKNFSEKHFDIPSGDVWNFTAARFQLNTQTQEGFLKCCQLIAEASGQVLSLLSSDTSVSLLSKVQQQTTPRKVENIPFVPNAAYPLRVSFTSYFTNWESRIGQQVQHYWSRWKVSIDYLQRYDVRPLQTRGLFTPCSSRDIAFAYLPKGETHTIKYKRPYAPDKSKKERYIQSTGNYVFGYEQLPSKGKILLLAAGEKDTLCLNQHLNPLGIYAICLYGENANLDKDFLETLRRRFDHIYCIYDNDITGIRMMSKNARLHGISPIRLSSHVPDSINDVADMVEQLGVAALQDFVQQAAVPKPLKASDCLIGENLDNTILNVPTGGGKTYFTLRSMPGKKVIVVPTKNLVKNIVHDCQQDKLDIFEFRRSKYQTKQLRKIKHLNQVPETIVTTYASFEALAKLLTPYIKQLKLVVDEAHNFTAAANPSFQLQELKSIMAYAPLFKSMTFLTGTPLYNAHPILKEMRVLDVPLARPPKDLHILHTANTLQSVAQLARESRTQGRFPIILLDNKSTRLDKLKAYLPEDFAYFNSDTKEDTTYAQLVKDGQINTQLKGIVTTSVLKEGNNIYNPYHYDIFIVGAHHSASIEQMANRPRCPKSTRIYVIKNIDTTQDTACPSLQEISNKLQRKCETLIRELNTQSTEAIDIVEEAFAYQQIQSMPIEAVDGRYQIDTLRLSNKAYQLLATCEYRNDDLLIKNLAQYGINFAGFIKEVEAMNEELKAKAIQNVQERKKERDQQYQAALIALQEGSFRDFDLVQGSAQSKLAFERLEQLRKMGLRDEHAFELLQTTGRSQAAFKQLSKRLHFRKLFQNPDFMNSGRLLALFVQAIQQEFDLAPDEARRLDKEIVHTKVMKCLNVLKNVIDIDYFKQGRLRTRTLKLLRLFYEVRYVKPGGCPKIEVQHLNLDKVISTISPKEVQSSLFLEELDGAVFQLNLGV